MTFAEKLQDERYFAFRNGKAEGKANLLAGLSTLINFLKPLGRESEIPEAIQNPEKLAELQEEFDVKIDG